MLKTYSNEILHENYKCTSRITRIICKPTDIFLLILCTSLAKRIMPCLNLHNTLVLFKVMRKSGLLKEISTNSVGIRKLNG